jgi:hypothetical protein
MSLFSSLRSMCMRTPSCVCKPKLLNQKYYSKWECMKLFLTIKLLRISLSCIVCLKCFLLVGVCYISYKGFFQTKVYKIGSWYNVRKTKNEKLVLCENLVSLISLRSRYYVLRRWTHYFTYTDVAIPTTV